MKILLSAYSIGAGRGSEPGVGWNVARGLALRGHEVIVVSNSKHSALNHAAIEQEGLSLTLIEDDCGLTEFNGRVSYRFWQSRIPKRLAEIAEEHRVDVVHHITFNQYRDLHDVFGCNKPFLIGPIGGAEKVAPALLMWGGLNRSFLSKEIARYCPVDAWSLIRRYNRVKEQGKIITSTPSTCERLSHGLLRIRKQIDRLPIIAVREEEIVRQPAAVTQQKAAPYFLIHASLKVAVKGLSLVLRSMQEYRRRGGQAKLMIVGLGEAEAAPIQNMMQELGLTEEAVELVPYIPRAEMLKRMQGARALLYTGYRDAGGMAALEALSMGSNLICFDIPSQFWLPDWMAYKVAIPSVWQGRKGIVNALVRAMEQVDSAPERDEEWHRRRYDWLCRHMTWEVRLAQLEAHYRSLIDGKELS